MKKLFSVRRPFALVAGLLLVATPVQANRVVYDAFNPEPVIRPAVPVQAVYRIIAPQLQAALAACADCPFIMRCTIDSHAALSYFHVHILTDRLRVEVSRGANEQPLAQFDDINSDGRVDQYRLRVSMPEQEIQRTYHEFMLLAVRCALNAQEKIP